MDALAGAARAAAERHLAGCHSCRQELQDLRDTLTRMPAIASADLDLERLVARVQDRLNAARNLPAARWKWRLVALPAAAAAFLAVLLLLVPRIVDSVKGTKQGWQGTPGPGIVLSEDELRRLERNLHREHAARYLSDAQDVLVTVVDTLPRCRREGHVDVAEEARRSQDLLDRRVLLVEDTQDLASVRPVIEEVDNVLREVAALDECARKADIEAIGATLERDRLLMKMDLMARELLG